MMTEPAQSAVCGLCPRCGHSLAAERRVRLGPLDYDPRGDVRWHGDFVALTPPEHLVLGSLVHAAGALVPLATLNERIDYDGDHRLAEVYLCRLRRKLRHAGAPANLVQNVRARGHRLNLPLLEELGEC